MRVIQLLRNTGVHYSRFYGKRYTYNPTLLFSDMEKLEFVDNKEKESWNTFLNKLQNS
ncbi:hypothetical protein CDIV41_230160 [Carnobacterium divergens]|nr:hypothetical protein CDIV41_230160 [Carnobacterium divergens]